MYSKDYLNFVARQHLPVDFHNIVEKLSCIIPDSGLLNYDINEIATEIDINKEFVKEMIELLLQVKPTLVIVEGNILVFDYDEKEVDYARHLQSALSNIGLLDL